MNCVSILIDVMLYGFIPMPSGDPMSHWRRVYLNRNNFGCCDKGLGQKKLILVAVPSAWRNKNKNVLVAAPRILGYILGYFAKILVQLLVPCLG